QRLLRGLFRTDQADLDFGIYRVINQKREEINRFLDEDLLPQVQEAFKEYQSYDNQSLESQLQEAIKQAEDLGFNPNESSKVNEIKEQMASYGVDVAELEKQVYAALYNFFRRYYDKGDFISQRRYKEGVYAIPYEGEEVKLHWANHDQYYIKTSEHLRNYTFKLQSGQLAHVKLVSADTEKDNRKEVDDKKRRFVLADDPLGREDGQLVIRFEYKEVEGRKKQEKLNEDAIEHIFALRDEVDDPMIKKALTELAALAPTDADRNRTLLAKHLGDYTRRNTQDYFIHKDLGRFLRQELDFFIKNEIMHLDDIESDTVPRVEQYLSKIKVIRGIAHKIIAHLAQIEDFQKKLWLKKKFVVDTQYCITLDRIPEELYPEIASNDYQREEWVRLFAIDENKGDLVTPSYSIPLTIAFLKANPFFVLDTKFFDQDFKYRLLASIENLDSEFDGLLIHSENFQALNLLREAYREKVHSIHIDPPYNTNSSGFLYKNEYKHASWLSMMKQLTELALGFLNKRGAFSTHIDEYEHEKLHFLYNQTQTIDAGTLVWDKGSPVTGAHGIATQHEYVLWRTLENLPNKVFKENIIEMQKIVKELIEKHDFGNKALSEYREWLRVNNNLSKAEKIYNIFDASGEIFRSADMGATDKRSNKKFYQPLQHPVTKQECPIPNNGWRYTPATMQDLLDKNLILFGNDHSTLPRRKILLKDNLSTQMPSVYRSGHRGKLELDNYGISFPFAHSTKLYKYLINSVANYGGELILDYFAGSGTTGDAVIKLNRQDKLSRKYILIEMGNHFVDTLLPRIEKVIYSEDWANGKPLSRKGSSHAFKYLKLESYEDTLNNLELSRSEVQTGALFRSDAFREDYLLSYMLDIESQGSLLSIKSFETPFDYKLQIATDSVGETVSTKIDLVETFNYLIGLQVNHISRIQGVVVVEGTTNIGEKTLVIWRNIHEMDNEKLDHFFERLDIRTRDFEYDVIYVNGDNNLPNLRSSGEQWKVRLIEEDFLRLMFADEGI
ncbi:DNA methyltransferase, partial [Chloroflexota bacterium]